MRRRALGDSVGLGVSAFLGVDEGFTIPFWSFECAVASAENVKAGVLHFRGGSVDSTGANGLVTHDSASSRGLFATDLELWLDECDKFAARRQALHNRRKELSEADERGVDDDEICEPSDLLRLKGAGVRSFKHNHPRVDAQLVRELAITDIDRDDRHGASLKQTVRKSAGRRSKIEAAFARGIDSERDERPLKLHAPTRYIWVILAAKRDFRVVWEKRAGLFNPRLANVDLSSENKRLRTGTRGGKSARDEELIGAKLHGVRLSNSRALFVTFMGFWLPGGSRGQAW
jgi:hypothetical protein